MERHISAEVEEELKNSLTDSYACDLEGTGQPAPGSPPDPALDSDEETLEHNTEDESSEVESKTPKGRGRGKGSSKPSRARNQVEIERALEACGNCCM